MPPQILKEEKDYIVINKPAGLMVHGDGRSNEKTLCDFLLEKFPEMTGVGEPLKISEEIKIDRPGIVHRLDRETSGVMIVARTKEGFEYLKNEFKNRSVHKTYHTFVYGNIREENGIIDSPIGRSKSDFRQWSAGKNARGEMREAVTEFRVLARTGDKSATFVEVNPKTGRTHQIRVHFKSIFHPVIADNLYAPGREKMFGFERLALHARSIEFSDISGKTVVYEAEYPEDFARAIEIIGKG